MDERYQLEYATRRSVLADKWYFGRDLGEDINHAVSELEIAQALARGNESGVTYRLVKITRELVAA